jgi:hypothetical protein
MNMQFVRPLAAIVVLTLVHNAPCARGDDAPPTVPAPSRTTAITPDDAKQFADQVEKTLHANDTSFFQSRFDDAALISKAARGLTISSAGLSGFSSTFKVGAKFSETVAAVEAKGADFHLLNVGVPDQQPRPLFRMLNDPGVNYIEFELGRSPDGQIRMIDMYYFSTGEWISQTAHRLLLALAASENRNALQKLVGTDNDYVTHLNQILAFENQSNSGQWQQGLATYSALPGTLQQEKTLMFLWVVDSRQAGDAPYASAMDAFAKVFPHDPSLMLMQIDALTLKQQYDQALATINQLDQRVGGDPYLDFLRGSTCIVQGKTAEGKKFITQATVREPRLTKPWFTLIGLALQDKDNAETAGLLDESEVKGGISWTKVSTSAVYADFVKSPEYAAWHATHPQDSDAATQPAQ